MERIPSPINASYFLYIFSAVKLSLIIWIEKKNLRWNAKACSTLKTKKHHRETDGQWNQEASISIKAESDPILRPQWNTRAHITTLFAFTGHIRTNQISPIIFPPINLFFLFFYFSLQHLYSFINKKKTLV